MTKYYSVGINDTWTKESCSLKYYQDKGCHIQDSRTHGDKQAFINDNMVAWLFSNQNEQKQFLASKGLI